MAQYKHTVIVFTIGLYVLQIHGMMVPREYESMRSPEDNLLDTVLEDDKRPLYTSILEKILESLLRSADTEDAYESDALYPDISDNPEYQRALPQQSTVSKRKVFWQPLGYVPASMRMSQQTNKHPQSGKSNGRKGFRYGRK